MEILALKMNRAYAVQDPELTLLDSNFTELNKIQLLFRPSGKYKASTHFIHVRIPFKLFSTAGYTRQNLPAVSQLH
jgi:hypothetical protein